MILNELLVKANVAAIGEEIGEALGQQMISDYQTANPSDVHSYVVGRQIIEQILAQPGCAAIRFFNAYNEAGEKTLVYVGLDANGNCILQYTQVNAEGQLSAEKGIVADRIWIPTKPNPTTPTDPDSGINGDDWGWTLD